MDVRREGYARSTVGPFGEMLSTNVHRQLPTTSRVGRNRWRALCPATKECRVAPHDPPAVRRPPSTGLPQVVSSPAQQKARLNNRGRWPLVAGRHGAWRHGCRIGHSSTTTKPLWWSRFRRSSLPSSSRWAREYEPALADPANGICQVLTRSTPPRWEGCRPASRGCALELMTYPKGRSPRHVRSTRPPEWRGDRRHKARSPATKSSGAFQHTGPNRRWPEPAQASPASRLPSKAARRRRPSMVIRDTSGSVGKGCVHQPDVDNVDVDVDGGGIGDH